MLQSLTLGRNHSSSGGSSTSTALVLGSSSAGSSNSSDSSLERSLTAQPLFELGMAKEDVKARLAPIPVYTVANPKNEFVLVAGEVSSAAQHQQYHLVWFRSDCSCCWARPRGAKAVPAVQ